MNNWLKNNQLLNFTHLTNRIFKQECALCLSTSVADNFALCQPCLNTLPYIGKNRCLRCSMPLTGNMNANAHICGRCLKHPPYFDETHAILRYQFPADKLLQHYKYQEALYLSHSFGALIVERLSLTNIDVIIPMPLHENRLKARGFNQSIEVAKIISEHTNIPLDITGCQKIKDSPPQASLAYKDRIKNIKKAFVCNKQYAGLNVAIIDDVMTTGATLNELAKTLKQAGAAHVSCYVLARA